MPGRYTERPGRQLADRPGTLPPAYWCRVPRLPLFAPGGICRRQKPGIAGRIYPQDFHCHGRRCRRTGARPWHGNPAGLGKRHRRPLPYHRARWNIQLYILQSHSRKTLKCISLKRLFFEMDLYLLFYVKRRII